MRNVLAVLALLAVSGNAFADNDCRKPIKDVPAALAVPADQCVALQVHGAGVQIYTCTAGAWVLKAPEANLMKEEERFVGNHYLGPTWQWKDGSKIKAVKKAGVDAPNPANDIPWLLLSVTDRDGEGKLDDVTFVQRLFTSGGVAPPGACVAGTADIRVNYSAEYVFYHQK